MSESCITTGLSLIIHPQREGERGGGHKGRAEVCVCVCERERERSQWARQKNTEDTAKE